jgi:hypothetical protein
MASEGIAIVAGKKSAPADRMPNRKYVPIDIDSTATNAVHINFDTMMGARQGAGWLISRVEFGFISTPPLMAGSPQAYAAQLCTGDQDEILDADDDNVIATLSRQINNTGSVGGDFRWPQQWVGPVLVASRKLSCVVDCAADVAPWKSAKMLMTIWYNWVKLSAQDFLDIAEAKGVA